MIMKVTKEAPYFTMFRGLSKAKIGAVSLLTVITFCLYLADPFTPYPVHADYSAIRVTPRDEDHMLRNLEMDESRTCSRVINFVFTKTHKTGSSTIANLLLRLSEEWRTNLLLARLPDSTTEYGYLSHHTYYPPPVDQTYNAFLLHSKFNPDFLQSKLPSDTQFFTMIRHPVSRYISGISFYNIDQKYDKQNFNNAVSKHIEKNSNYMKKTTKCSDCKNVVNSVGNDLGFDFKAYLKSNDQHQFMEDWLKARDSLYSLVLINEYFDISLVLLKRHFCWSISDILYFRSLTSSEKQFVDESNKQKIFEFQEIDSAIYQYFNRTFWSHVEKEKGIMEEVVEFQRIRKEVVERCISGKKMGDYGTWDHVLSEYGLQSFTCKALNTRVGSFARLIQQRNQGLRDSKSKNDADALDIDDVWNNRPL